VLPRLTAARLGGAAVAGLLSVVALSPGGAGWLAWGALVPLFLALRGVSGRATIALVIVYSLVFGIGNSGPWLLPATAAYFDLGLGRAVVYLLPALVLTCAAHGLVLGLALWAGPRGPGAWSVLWTAAAWAVWESSRTHVFPYYPAAVLGLSQGPGSPVLQVASLGGVAAVSFVVVAWNVGLASLLHASAGPRGRRLAAAGAGLVAVLLALGWGVWLLAGAEEPFPAAADVIAVDVNAPRWSASTLEAYLAASEGAALARPTLLVWPENALTTDVEHDRAAWAALSAFVAAHETPLLTGGPGSAAIGGREMARFNSAHLLIPRRGMRSYHKRALVPLAESWPGVLGTPPAAFRSLDAGREATVFAVADTAFGVLICFEITDPAGARALARRGARFLVNLTNDVWFGAAAPHLAWAPVRAVETGLPVVRAANAGVSAVFDRFGRTLETSRPTDRPAFLATSIPPAAPTPYARFGDLFLAACLAMVVTGLLFRRP
jgi:apolipoprotein N-acyltransferase